MCSVTTSCLINPILLEERCVGNRKITLPKKLTGVEDDKQHALIYYTAQSKLNAEKRGIDPHSLIMQLANTVNLDHVADLNMPGLFGCLDEQTFDPYQMKVLLFHNQIGTRLRNTTIQVVNKLSLLPLGDSTTSLGQDVRRVNNIRFALVTVDIDFF